jgi:tripartite-type tricarboxylate transporter receptor subunit TctC
VGEIFFVVPFGRDGAADRAARKFAAELSSLRMQGSGITIENLPGDGGARGVQRANSRIAAGMPVMLLGTPSTHVLLPERFGPIAAPSAKLQPLAGLGSTPNVLLVSPRLGVRTVGDLVARARAGKLVYASAGAGQTIHACTALFCEQAGIEMEHRPYDAGSATAYQDLAAGRVHVYFDNVIGAIDHIVLGEAIPLAVSSYSRSDLLPEVPTLVACGFVDHALDVWLGVFGANLDEETMRAAAKAGAIDAPKLAQEIEGSARAWRRALEATSKR